MTFRQAKQRHRKQQQRERQRAWLVKKYGVRTAEALVSLLMRLDKKGD